MLQPIPLAARLGATRSQVKNGAAKMQQMGETSLIHGAEHQVGGNRQGLIHKTNVELRAHVFGCRQPFVRGFCAASKQPALKIMPGKCLLS